MISDSGFVNGVRYWPQQVVHHLFMGTTFCPPPEDKHPLLSSVNVGSQNSQNSCSGFSVRIEQAHIVQDVYHVIEAHIV